jgi:NAD(P)-dependent dehydrogenase (short-subunit alcohol dehydrogenase family)
MNKKLQDKIAIITGANQGLGFEIAKNFLISGANVVICARNADLLEKARLNLASYATDNQKILSMPSDVSSINEVKEIVNTTLKELKGCHILVNNAGIYGPKGSIETNDWSEWVKTIEINLFGSILMARELIPIFKKQRYGKIIQLSGGGATNPMPNISAYAVSKAAVIRFMETIAEELKGFNIDVNAIAPGALNTRMLDEIMEAGPDKVGMNFFEKSKKQKDNGGAGFIKASELAVFLANNDSDGITGKLISAVWDKWEEFPSHKDELNSSDIFTLRRIVGRDRNISWSDK